MSLVASRPTPTRMFDFFGDPLSGLRSRLIGRLITAESLDYDSARSTVNLLMDRRPLAIVQAAGTPDVVAAVNFAREMGITLTVRSGGHSLGKFGVVDDAVVIDLSAMKRVRIDPVARVAYVQAGATSGDLAGPAHEHGLALSTGDTHSVGMGGLTTGGGIGFMVRKHGLAIDNLLSAELVLADGQVVTASPEEHSELFWAIRGGGGNFGVITEFTYRLAPVGHILGGDLLLPASREAVRGYLEYAASAPDDLTTIAALMHAPPAPYVPADRVGEEALSILVVWTGDPEEGERVLAPLRALAEPIADAVSVIPYPDIYRFTAHQAQPHGVSLRMMFADELSDAALDASLDALREATSPYSMVHLRAMGGAMARVPVDATAFAHRTQRYFYAPIAIWLDKDEDAAVHEAWTRSLWEKVRSEGRGAYVNFLEQEGPNRIRDAYPRATYARLAEIKSWYDPENLFRHNQNVPPADEPVLHLG